MLAPYLLSALMERPDRIVMVSSGMHLGMTPDLGHLQWERRPWDGWGPYAESTLWDVVLAFALARLPQRAGQRRQPRLGAHPHGRPRGARRPRLGGETPAWLAAGEGEAADVTGAYLFHRRPEEADPVTYDHATQDALLAACASLTGVTLPPA
jgi:hypothetical protein